MKRKVTVGRAELKALILMCVYTTVCPKTSRKAFDSLVTKGLARKRSTKISNKKVVCYKSTPLGMSTLRALYVRYA